MTHKWRARDKYTRWENESPLNNIQTVLYLLQDTQGGRSHSKSHIRIASGSADNPELRIEWYHEGDSGGDSSGTYYLDIEPAISKEIIEKSIVEPMRVPTWGHTITEKHKLVLSEDGKRMISSFEAAQKGIARSLLVPGTHSKFSGLFNDAGSGYDGWLDSGRLYFDFVTPQDERIRVYPGTKEVVPQKSLRIRSGT